MLPVKPTPGCFPYNLSTWAQAGSGISPAPRLYYAGEIPGDHWIPAPAPSLAMAYSPAGFHTWNDFVVYVEMLTFATTGSGSKIAL